MYYAKFTHVLQRLLTL